jgi:hypothetical protein
VAGAAAYINKRCHQQQPQLGEQSTAIQLNPLQQLLLLAAAEKAAAAAAVLAAGKPIFSPANPHHA